MHPALTIFFAGQLGKYVPGSVWTAAIQADLGRRRSIARSTMLVSYVVALMIAVATGGLVGLLVLLGAGAPRAMALWMLLLAAVVGAALLRPGLDEPGPGVGLRPGRPDPAAGRAARAGPGRVRRLADRLLGLLRTARLAARPTARRRGGRPRPDRRRLRPGLRRRAARRAAAGRGGCARGGPGGHARRVDRGAGRPDRQPRVAPGPARRGPGDGGPVRRRRGCPRGPRRGASAPRRTRAQPNGPLSSMQSPCRGACPSPARLL